MNTWQITDLVTEYKALKTATDNLAEELQNAIDAEVIKQMLKVAQKEAVDKVLDPVEKSTGLNLHF